MEDSHIIAPNFDQDTSLFAIFDGHGGEEVAIFCSNHFELELKQNQNYQEKAFIPALEETFEKMDLLLRTPEGKQELNEIRKFDKGESNAGCTALVVLLYKKQLYVANAGDCRCLMFNE